MYSLHTAFYNDAKVISLIEANTPILFAVFGSNIKNSNKQEILLSVLFRFSNLINMYFPLNRIFHGSSTLYLPRNVLTKFDRWLSLFERQGNRPKFKK